MTWIDKNRAILPTGVGKITQQKRHSTKSALINGGPDRTRTCDLLRVKQALYQLSYRSQIVYMFILSNNRLFLLICFFVRGNIAIKFQRGVLYLLEDLHAYLLPE